MKWFLLLIFLITNIFAGEYKVIKVVDGDTINVVKKGLEENKYNTIKVRLAFIDTMESARNNRAKKISSDCNLNIEKIVEIGKKSKTYLSTLLKDKEVNIIFHGMDDLEKRHIGEIYLDNDDNSINEKMIEFGQAVPFYKYIRKMDPENMDYYIYLFNKNKHEEILDNHCLNKKLGI